MTIKRMMLVIVANVSFEGIQQGVGYVVKALPYSHPGDKIVFFDLDDALKYAFSQASLVKVCRKNSYQYFLNGRYYGCLQRLRDERTREFFWRLSFGHGSVRFPNSDLGEKKVIERISMTKPELVQL
jgi:hypothetical protein